jgi:selenocysteine lyase/cysteine desulfurase
LQHLERIGFDAIHDRVVCLTTWLLESLTQLRHADGRRLVQILGPTDTDARGGTVTFVMTATGTRSTTVESRNSRTPSTSRCEQAASATQARARSPTS